MMGAEFLNILKNSLTNNYLMQSFNANLLKQFQHFFYHSPMSSLNSTSFNSCNDFNNFTLTGFTSITSFNLNVDNDPAFAVNTMAVSAPNHRPCARNSHHAPLWHRPSWACSYTKEKESLTSICIKFVIHYIQGSFN